MQQLLAISMTHDLRATRMSMIWHTILYTFNRMSLFEKGHVRVLGEKEKVPSE